MKAVIILLSTVSFCVCEGKCACAGSRGEVHNVDTATTSTKFLAQEESDTNEVPSGSPATKANGWDCGKAFIPPGPFKMGAEDNLIYPEDDESPIREVQIPEPGFWMDKCEVTAGQFKKFVKASKYITDAEAYGWSFVFEQLLSESWQAAPLQHVQSTPWWKAVPRSWWRQPMGNDSSIKGMYDHPATHISWTDAYYYCRWKGGRLPSEVEWERASRGGLEQQPYPWGDELKPDGKFRMNTWQGKFAVGQQNPYSESPPQYELENTAADGHRGTSPVGTFPANAYGLYDMTGNVWEWTDSEFTGARQALLEREKPKLPNQSPATSYRVKKGGSYMCHADYCRRYRNSARQGLESDSSAGNVGFRCAYDLEW